MIIDELNELCACMQRKLIFLIPFKRISDSEQNKLIEESLVMAKFDHLNVMKLIGVSPHATDSLYIVMPFMIYGSLLSYLRKQRADLTILTTENMDLVRSYSWHPS